MEDLNKTQIRVLVVDDEPNISAYVGQVLTRRRSFSAIEVKRSERELHVDTACDGQSALELVRQNNYDFVVLDYRMPGMNGGQVCRQIHETQPEAYVVLLTGYPTIDVLNSAIEDGARRLLSKPVNPEELVGVLETQLA